MRRQIANLLLLGTISASAGFLQACSLGSSSPVSDINLPGTLLSSQSVEAYVLPSIPIQAKAWHILYRSTTATGGVTEVSGTVLVPTAAWNGPGPRPLVGYAIGTQGLAARCAPSAQLAAGTEYEGVLIADAIGRGWAIALTDYPGLGTPGGHPYVVGNALGYAVLDSMRAALQLREAGIDPQAPLAIVGYSEGGMAAGWALQLQPSYAPDLPLVGGAVGAAPADLFAAAAHVNGTPLVFLNLYLVSGFEVAFPGLGLDRYLSDRGRNAVNEYRNTCIEDAAVLALTMPTQWSAYVASDPFNAPDVRARIEEQGLGNVPPAPPLILGSSTLDEAIPYQSMQALYQDWCALGVNAHFQDLQGDHITAGVEFGTLFAFPFLADRFAGKPLDRAPSCSK